jgi:hypothetical protein
MERSHRVWQLSLDMLLTSFRNPLASDSCDKVFGVFGMTQEYIDQRALSVDYSLSKRETYIKTVQSLIERGRHSDSGPLNIICANLPHLSVGDLPSWVPDWSPPPKTNSNSDLGKPTYLFRANGASHLGASYKIDGGVLIVNGLTIVGVDHLNTVPGRVSDQLPFNAFHVKYLAERVWKHYKRSCCSQQTSDV